MTDLTLVELFAGIGGFSCAFERAGVKTVAAVEINQAARRVFANNFPDAALFEDVTKVGGDDLRAVGFIPERGIITGGWPCQDISIAGRGAGLDGERSGLFSEVVRLLTDLKPAWFVLENVPRLLTINGGRDMGTVVTALGECGYGFAYRVLDAQYFGVAQRRRRILFVGHLGGTGHSSAQVLFEPEGMRRDSQESGEKKQKVATKDSQCVGDCCGGEKNIVGTLQTNQRGTPNTDSVAGGQLVVERIGVISVAAALTANGVGTCGADDNQAQAGHLIAERNRS